MISALVIVAALAVISCDERNDADIPPVVYSLKRNIVTPGVAQYVYLADNQLAVAASRAGTYLYNISNVNSPAELYHYEATGVLYATMCAVDPVNGLFLSVFEPDGATGTKYPIYEYATNTWVGQATFTGNIQEVEIESYQDQFFAWRTDQSAGDGLAASAYCFNPDSGQWYFDSCERFTNSYIPSSGVHLRGFGFKDSLFAIAQSNFEIVLFNSMTGVANKFMTPGDPQDCAWRGDYIIVADNFFLSVVNAAQFDAPALVASYAIPGADRLQRVEVDGDYAVVMDDSDGLYIVDISNPAHPNLVQSISLPEPTYVTAQNGTMVASDEQLGVLIYQR